MLLHEPILTFDLAKYTHRKLKYFYFNKNDFINVDGFINENSPCIMLLSAPLLKNKFNFHNLKAPTYIVNKPDKTIFDECEKNKNIIIENNQNHIINSDIINQLEDIKDEYINDNKINKTFEEKLSNNNSYNSNNKKSPINHKILNYINPNNYYIKSSQNNIKTNGVYNNINKNININNQKNLKKNDNKIKLNNNSIDKPKIDEIKSNSIDSKILYKISPPNTIANKNCPNPADIAKNYFNNLDKTKNVYQKKYTNAYFLSSSTGNIGLGIKDKNENNKENNNINIAKKNNNFKNLQNDQSIIDVIVGNLNKLKETKLKEYYNINNRNKNKNGVRNKNSKYCIKNHIYSNIKNIPNTTNNRMINKKNNYNHSNSQHYDLLLDKKISPSPSKLFKSYDINNDSSEIINIPSPKNEKTKNYNSFTHLLKFSNMISKSSVNTQILSPQNNVYNNLVLKGIKNNFENNPKIKNSTNNIRFNTNYKMNFINNSNSYNNSIHNSTVNRNNFNPLSNRKKYISFIIPNEHNNQNKSEIKERCSMYNYQKMDIKNKSKNNSSISNKPKYNNCQRHTNVANNINPKKNKKLQKKIIKNNILISEGIFNQKYFNNFNCKKINNNEIHNKNIDLNNKNNYKNTNSKNNSKINNNNNNKLNLKKNNINYTMYKNNSNNNIKIKEPIYFNNNPLNEESNLFKFSPNNTFIQKTINKSSSPEKNYSTKNKNIIKESKDNNNNILYHRNSNTTLYNNYFITSESDNNISSNKTNQLSYQVKKTKRKVSNLNNQPKQNKQNNIYTNNYKNNHKNKMNKHKEKVIKYIKSINIINNINKYGTNINKGASGNIINQNIFGLKQIYKNNKYSFQKTINSMPMEIYIKTEDNLKETQNKESYIINQDNKNEFINKTIEENKKASSFKKGESTKRKINLGINMK